MTFGEKLKHYRKKKGLTQLQLAKKCNLSLNTINNYEKKNTYPRDRDVYETLANALDINVDLLRNEESESSFKKKIFAGIYVPRELDEGMELPEELYGDELFLIDSDYSLGPGQEETVQDEMSEFDKLNMMIVTFFEDESNSDEEKEQLIHAFKKAVRGYKRSKRS